MLDIKIISLFTIVGLFFIGCEESTKVETSSSYDSNDTTSNPNLGHETAHIQDYFYDFDEKVNAQYLYSNLYFTRGANTFANLNPYKDTLNFSTFPSYTVTIDNQAYPISYQLALTTANINDYSTLYPLNELNTSANNWCRF